MQRVLNETSNNARPESRRTSSTKNGRRGLKALLLSLVVAALTLSLAGCFNGMNAGTQEVGPSGDGVNATLGDGTLQIRNLVWVQDKDNAKNLTLSGAFNNVSTTDDTLTEVTTNPKSTVTITGGPIVIPAVTDGTDNSVRVGYNADKYVDANGIEVVPSGYVSTTLKFKNAGASTMSILVVAPTGAYADVKSK